MEATLNHYGGISADALLLRIDNAQCAYEVNPDISDDTTQRVARAAAVRLGGGGDRPWRQLNAHGPLRDSLSRYRMSYLLTDKMPLGDMTDEYMAHCMALIQAMVDDNVLTLRKHPLVEQCLGGVNPGSDLLGTLKSVLMSIHEEGVQTLLSGRRWQDIATTMEQNARQYSDQVTPTTMVDSLDVMSIIAAVTKCTIVPSDPALHGEWCNYVVNTMRDPPGPLARAVIGVRILQILQRIELLRAEAVAKQEQDQDQQTPWRELLDIDSINCTFERAPSVSEGEMQRVMASLTQDDPEVQGQIMGHLAPSRPGASRPSYRISYLTSARPMRDITSAYVARITSVIKELISRGILVMRNVTDQSLCANPTLEPTSYLMDRLISQLRALHALKGDDAVNALLPLGEDWPTLAARLVYTVGDSSISRDGIIDSMDIRAILSIVMACEISTKYQHIIKKLRCVFVMGVIRDPPSSLAKVVMSIRLLQVMDLLAEAALPAVSVPVTRAVPVNTAPSAPVNTAPSAPAHTVHTVQSAPSHTAQSALAAPVVHTAKKAVIPVPAAPIVPVPVAPIVPVPVAPIVPIAPVQAVPSGSNATVKKKSPRKPPSAVAAYKLGSIVFGTTAKGNILVRTASGKWRYPTAAKAHDINQSSDMRIRADYLLQSNEPEPDSVRLIATAEQDRTPITRKTDSDTWVEM